MTELGPKYTQRQLDLLKGIVKPTSDEEVQYMDNHANDILPKEEKEFRPYGNLTGADLDKSKARGGPSTFAGHIGDSEDDD